MRSLVTALLALTLLVLAPAAHAEEPVAPATQLTDHWFAGPSVTWGRFQFVTGDFGYDVAGIGATIGYRVSDVVSLNLNLNGAAALRDPAADKGIGSALSVRFWDVVGIGVGVDWLRVNHARTGLLTGDVDGSNVYLLLDFGIGLLNRNL